MTKKTLIIVSLLLVSIISRADIWPNEKTTDFYSANRLFMLRVVPRFVPEKYYKWERSSTKKRDRFNEKDTVIVPCHAFLYKISNTDTTIVWERNLINMFSPVSALISNDGMSVITFDSWYGLGYGVDVMVVYNEKGDLRKRYSLEEISPFPINDFRFTISSIIWKEDCKYIDNKRIELSFINSKDSILKRIYNVEKLDFESDLQP
jgi:hypothetical protein